MAQHVRRRSGAHEPVVAAVTRPWPHVPSASPRAQGERSVWLGRRVFRPSAHGGQHHYQHVAFALHQAHGVSSRVTMSLVLGLVRLQLSVPGQLRLWRFRLKHRSLRLFSDFKSFMANPRTRRSIEQAFPLLLLTALTAACSLASKDGGDGLHFSLGPMPELAKKKTVPGARRTDAPWTYVLPIDHGVRIDQSGQGYFRAPRFHGEHNGLDLLAPVGTAVYAPCEGKMMVGASPSFGSWVQVVCPVPAGFAIENQPHPWVSFFFAHLSRTPTSPEQWFDVHAGDQVGEVGKTGNAQDVSIQPHLHLELIVQRNRRSAMDERHLGADQSNVEAAQQFARVLDQQCMERYGFVSKTNEVRRARRIDPFIALTCLSDFKPNFKKAPSPLSSASKEWAQFYFAKDFNVNLGVEDSILARH